MGTMEDVHKGEKIIVGGLIFQLIFFTLFVVVAGDFHRRLINDIPVKKRYGPRTLLQKLRPNSRVDSSFTAVALLPRSAVNELPWKRHIYVLYGTSALILVRNVFRIAEYIEGNAGHLLSHEAYLYIFDALLMLTVMCLLNWIHPSEVTDLYNRRQAASSVELRMSASSLGQHDTSYSKPEATVQSMV
jgi:hypothetical protein